MFMASLPQGLELYATSTEKDATYGTNEGITLCCNPEMEIGTDTH
jgi:hypothetical protein